MRNPESRLVFRTNVLTDQPLQHLLHIFDDGIQVEHARIHHLLTAECEELPRQVPPLDVPPSAFHRRKCASGCLRACPPGQFPVSDDHAQQVIEIVGDTARESSYRLHFLSLAELFFESLALRDIAIDNDKLLGLSALS